MNKAVIGLGSNIEPDQNIEKAKALLSEQYTYLNESAFIVTKPIGMVDQADFLNGAVYIQTEETMEDLRASLKGIEVQLGRKHGEDKFGPRTIDLDVIVFNEKVVDQDFYDRDFLKKSVLELLPELKY